MLQRTTCALPRAFVPIGLAVLVSLLAALPAVAAPSYADWFRYGEGTRAAWNVSAVPGDAFRVLIRRKDKPEGSAARRIFVFYPRPSSAYDTAITKILEVFAEKDINAEFLVFNFRRSGERGQVGLQLAMEGAYELIFSMGSESTAWLYEHFSDGPIPVVSVCSKDPVLLGQARDYRAGSGTNFALTSLNMPIEAQMTYVLQLKPNLRNIGVLVDSKNVSAVQTQAKPLSAYARRRGIRVFDLAVQDPKSSREELTELVSDAVAAMRKNDPSLENSVFWVTGSTAVFREIQTINAHADRVPVLSVVPEVVTAGEDSAVLSVGISFLSNAHLAAIYGADVLSKRVEPGDLEVGVVSPPDIAINFRKAREIGLKIPFSFFESASYVYDYEGRIVRDQGKSLVSSR